MNAKNCLIGRKVTKAYLSPDKTAIELIMDSGDKVTMVAHGECCSRSWFEHVNGTEFLLGEKVLDFKEIDMDKDINTDDGLLRFYRVELHTSKGVFELDLRNESNGYYGGEVVLVYTDGSRIVNERYLDRSLLFIRKPLVDY